MSSEQLENGIGKKNTFAMLGLNLSVLNCSEGDFGELTLDTTERHRTGISNQRILIFGLKKMRRRGAGRYKG